MSESKDQATSGTRQQPRTSAVGGDERELARIERRLHTCWRDLAAAEQRGVPEHLLERMYANYLRLLDAYVATQRRLRGRAPRAASPRNQRSRGHLLAQLIARPCSSGAWPESWQSSGEIHCLS